MKTYEKIYSRAYGDGYLLDDCGKKSRIFAQETVYPKGKPCYVKVNFDMKQKKIELEKDGFVEKVSEIIALLRENPKYVEAIAASVIS